MIGALKDAFENRTFCPNFIIHTDRGPQLTSQEWHLFVEQLGATGSMSDFARPKDNAVAERTIRTIKSQLLKCQVSWPKKVKSLREIQFVLDKKVAFYNHEFIPKRACGITRVELRPALDAVEHFAPPRVIAHPNGDLNHKAVIEFKQKAIETLDLSDNPYYMLRTTRDDVKHIKGHLGHQLEQQSHELLNSFDKSSRHLLRHANQINPRESDYLLETRPTTPFIIGLCSSLGHAGSGVSPSYAFDSLLHS